MWLDNSILTSKEIKEAPSTMVSREAKAILLSICRGTTRRRPVSYLLSADQGTVTQGGEIPNTSSG